MKNNIFTQKCSPNTYYTQIQGWTNNRVLNSAKIMIFFIVTKNKNFNFNYYNNKLITCNKIKYTITI